MAADEVVSATVVVTSVVVGSTDVVSVLKSVVAEAADVSTVMDESDVSAEEADVSVEDPTTAEEVAFTSSVLNATEVTNGVTLGLTVDDALIHVFSIDRYGVVNKGLSKHGHITRDCRDRSRLDNANVYTRKRCNNGWCAYITRLPLSGHKHDWENVVVFVTTSTIQRVVASAHGKYRHKDKPLLQDGHPLIVYHKSFMSTHALRFAKDEDVKEVENDYGKWVMADLIGWDGFPTQEFKKKLSRHKFGKANFHLKDGQFAWSLEKAAGDAIPGFNCQKDGGNEYKNKDQNEKKGMRKEKQKKKVKDKSEIQVKEKDVKNDEGED
ncbi:hypothetical protein FOC4_g10001219 [Fusarium odoratissimum]|uniref:Uncharacterized protein n=1 Tax=Fusarium oxysporum f. sp. cubense (strain race 4) TaxID=2502994 RepID=N1S7M8_FUSC4|nr:hypothetical protein FOC4_g10001219 [Fusarium odoratissimum]